MKTSDPFIRFLHIQTHSKEIIKEHIPLPSKVLFAEKPFPASHYSYEDQMEIYYADGDPFIICDQYNISRTTYDAICRDMARRVRIEIAAKKRDNFKKELKAAKGTLHEVAARFKVSVSTVFMARNDINRSATRRSRAKPKGSKTSLEIQS